MKMILAVTALVIVGLLVTLFIRLGGYKPVEIHEIEAGPFQLVFKHHLGPYHQIVPTIQEVETWTKAQGEKCTQSFGEYIDDVDLVPEDRLQSNGGCVVSRELKSNLPEGFEFREQAKRKYVEAQFDGAPSIGPVKVYPKVRDYLTRHGLKQGGPVFEMYEILGANQVKTTYYFPIAESAGAVTPATPAATP